jgi:hypothetical protein
MYLLTISRACWRWNLKWKGPDARCFTSPCPSAHILDALQVLYACISAAGYGCQCALLLI